MRRIPHRFAAGAASLLAGLAIAVPPMHADNGPKIVTGVFCDTEAQIEGFAEAHLGAQLSILEATHAINKAAGKNDACSPISNAIVSELEEVKEMTIEEKSYTIT